MGRAIELSLEPQAAARLVDLASREQGLVAAVEGYRQVIGAYDNAIKAVEMPISIRIGEYQTGLATLQQERATLTIELRQATDASEKARIQNDIDNMDFAIQEHQLGIEQMQTTLLTATAEMRRLGSEAERDLQSHEQQLADVRAEFPAAQREMQEAAEQTARALRRLEELRAEIEAKLQQVNDCHERRRQEEPEAPPQEGDTQPPFDDGSGWFPP